MNLLFDLSGFEVYTVEAFLTPEHSHRLWRKLRCIPIESELIIGEILIGREIVNGKIKSLTMNLQEGYTAIEV